MAFGNRYLQISCDITNVDIRYIHLWGIALVAGVLVSLMDYQYLPIFASNILGHTNKIT